MPGVEWTNPPEKVREGCTASRSSNASTTCPATELAVCVRDHHTGRRAAHLRGGFPPRMPSIGFKSVTICEKPNVLRETSGMMEETAKEVAKTLSGRAAMVHEHRRADHVADQESRKNTV